MTSPIPTLDATRTAAYLDRLQVSRHAVTPDRAGLTLLHERHLRCVPFENLSIHLDEPIVLDVDALVDKLAARRRGGFCYELNGAFAALLATLGFDVTMWEARVGPGGGGMRFDHMCLRVRTGDRDLLADVGFGASFMRPLDLRKTGPQRDPAGTFEIVWVGDQEFDMVDGGAPQFRCSTVPRALDDFAGGCAHHQTSPTSHFTQATVCSLPVGDGRVTIRDRTLIRTTGNQRSAHDIADDRTLLMHYRDLFGIALDRVPRRTRTAPHAPDPRP